MGIATIGHAELYCPNFEEDVEHFKEVVGLEESLREDGRVYLRAYQDWDNYTLILTESDRNGLGHVALQVEEREDLDEYADRIESSGYEVTWQDVGVEPGQGESIRFETPADQEFELFYEMDRADIPPERRSRLKNQPQKRVDWGIGPTRIDHANLAVPNVEECFEWFRDVLDFKLREYIVDEEGNKTGVWISVSPLVHEVGLVQGDEPMLHHVAYYLKSEPEIYRAADVLTEHDVKIAAGPGHHGISQAHYLYHVTPSMNQIELFAGGYLIFDPNWEPVEWTPDELDDALYWWGRERDWSPEESAIYATQDYELGTDGNGTAE